MKTSLLKGWADNMKNLLKLEFRKMRKQKSFYICTLVMIGLLFLSVLTANALLTGNHAALAGTFAASGMDTAINAVNNSSFLMIAGIFVAIFVCDDYEQQTIKNIYARGYSRKQVYLSKLLAVWIGTTVMFVIVLLFAFICGTAYFGTGAFAGLRVIRILAVQYAACMANMSLCFLVSSLLRKNGSSIAATIVAPMLVNMLLGMLDSFMKLKEFSVTSVWVSSFMGDLSSLSVSSGRVSVCLIASLFYMAVFAVAGIASHKKIEL